ncbi:MAG: M48 family metalloprotease [Nitrososphaerota archaeon]|jgi:Zn-dependent protease with chaperone function|nr:M48 family metalloprotease [Nitrososphaerota archaeon]MDG6932866.1 M48 family metalloprotease [Nitrososphaerota archaeon]MDG6936281.1 M48 family metalloprotease [Nitrososphaerota archaeon]MDG6944911.1 M48 family metalloprotease [Nitrososphaerota archaeon]
MKSIESGLSEKLDEIAKRAGALKGLSSGCRYCTGDYPWLARYDLLRKRIVINEKFLNLLTRDEALAVLVHEEAHAAQRVRYIIRSIFAIIFSTVIIFAATQAEFALLGLLYMPQSVAIVLILILTLFDLGIMLPLVVKAAACTFNLKRFEMEADVLAAREIGKDQLISALEKAQTGVRHDSAPRKLFRWWMNYVDSCVHLPYEKRLEYIRGV